MAPHFKDEELVKTLNENIFDNEVTQFKATIDMIRNPTTDSTRDLIMAILNEAGFALQSNVISLPNDLTGPNEQGFINEYLPVMTVVMTANKFFESLSLACTESKPTQCYKFGLNDIIMPTYKRLRWFLCHFANYWLFMNNYYSLYEQTYQKVEGQANEKLDIEDRIRQYQKYTQQLQMEKASTAMKSQNLRSAIAHNQEKLGELTKDVNALGHETDAIKTELQNTKELEAALNKETSELEHNEMRLKAISKADEIKNELEGKIESLDIDQKEKMIQIQNYRLREEEMTSQDGVWKDILKNGSILVKLSSSAKKNMDEKKQLVIDNEASLEELSNVEAQLFEIQKLIKVLNADIALAKQKWEKVKVAREADLKEYYDTLKTLSKSTNEEDIISGELDSQISETMMATEALNEQQVKEKERIEKLYAKLVNAFEKFLEVMIKDANSLEKAKNGLNFGLKRGK